MYAWSTKAEAEAYLKVKQASVSTKLDVYSFSIKRSDLVGFNKFTVPLDDALANHFLSKYSSLYGQGLPHGFDYIIRNTGMGLEHYFAESVMHYIKWL